MNEQHIHVTQDFNFLVKNNHKKLHNFIRKHLNDLEHTEDILQQTYLVGLESQSRFKGNAKLETWIFGIAFNLVREHNRNTYRKNKSLEIDDYINLIEDPKSCIETKTHHQKYIDSLMAKFEILPEHMKEIIQLFSVDHVTYNDCAKKLSVPIGTIRSRLSRARDLLKEN